MEELKLRNLHRTAGIVLAFFLFLQGGTGLILTFLEMGESPEAIASESHEGKDSALEEALEFIHKKGGTVGDLYRIIIGGGLLFMVISGTSIFMKIKARSKK